MATLYWVITGNGQIPTWARANVATNNGFSVTGTIYDSGNGTAPTAPATFTAPTPSTAEAASTTYEL